MEKLLMERGGPKGEWMKNRGKSSRDSMESKKTGKDYSRRKMGMQV